MLWEGARKKCKVEKQFSHGIGQGVSPPLDMNNLHKRLLMTRDGVAGMAVFGANDRVMHRRRNKQQPSQREEDSAYSTFSFTTKPLAIARSRTNDIYRWRVMPDCAARASRRFTSLEVRRTVTGLAVSGFLFMACEHSGLKSTHGVLPEN